MRIPSFSFGSFPHSVSQDLTYDWRVDAASRQQLAQLESLRPSYRLELALETPFSRVDAKTQSSCASQRIGKVPAQRRIRNGEGIPLHSTWFLEIGFFERCVKPHLQGHPD
jgi:hypothetical protein